MTSNNTERVMLYETTFAHIGINESELRELLYKNISIVSEKLETIEQESSPWSDTRHKIDILCLEPIGKLVVIELKRHESKMLIGQAITYAAMLEDSLSGSGKEKIYSMLKDNKKSVPKDLMDEVKIILVTSDESCKLRLAVKKLQQLGLDINLIQIVPYEYIDRLVKDKVKLEISTFWPHTSFSEVVCYDLSLESNCSGERNFEISRDVTGSKISDVADIQEFSRETTKLNLEINGEEIVESGSIWLVLCKVVKTLICKDKSYLSEFSGIIIEDEPLLIIVDGKVDHIEFIKRAKHEVSNGKLWFFPWRYLCGDSCYLIHEGETKTYSVLNVYTICKFEKIMTEIKKIVGGKHEISYSVVKK